MYEDQDSVLGRAVFEEKPLPISDRDAKLEQLNTQMAEKANQADLTALAGRVDTIITTPVDGVSAQEIIDARQGAATLGANIEALKNQFFESALVEQTPLITVTNNKYILESGDLATSTAYAVRSFSVEGVTKVKITTSNYASVRNLVVAAFYTSSDTFNSTTFIKYTDIIEPNDTDDHTYTYDVPETAKAIVFTCSKTLPEGSTAPDATAYVILKISDVADKLDSIVNYYGEPYGVSWMIGGIAATGAGQVELNHALRTTSIVEIPADGYIQATGGYNLRVFWYQDISTGYVSTNLIKKTEYTTDPVQVAAGDKVGVMIADPQGMEQTDLSMAQYVDWHVYLHNIRDVVNELTDAPNKIKTKIENIIYATKISPTYVKHRYLSDKGTPTTTTSLAWNLYKLDVSQCDLVYVNTYKTSTASLVMWSFTTVDYDTATVENIDSSTIVGKSAKISATGEIAEKVVIPTGAKTMLIACASEYSESYPVTYIYNYSIFQELKEVPSIITGIHALNTKIAGLEVYNTSPYYRKVRWGCPAFDKYYHSVDNGISEFPSTTTAAQYFTKFNALVSDYTGYAESHEMGLASDETTTMYYYTFTPKTNQDSDSYKRPKIIVAAGQHGFEKTANFGVYYFAKDLLENWEENPFLDYLRNHVQLIFMPMLNPYGFDHDKYTNANGVNLNRNWDTSAWSSGTPGTTSYGGAEPLDQPETQYASAVILANLDALWLCDYHNNGQIAPSAQTGYLWHSFPLVVYDDKYFEKAVQAAKWHIDETTGHLYKDYPSIVSYDNCGIFTDNNAPSHQGLMTAYAREHNIMATTLEGAAAFIDSGDRYSSPIGHMNADLLGNWIRCILATYSHYADN